MKYVLGVFLGLIYFIILLSTLSAYGMNEDTPGHWLRGQTYLHKLITGENFIPQPNLPSPILFVPGQRVSSYKYNVYESHLSLQRPVYDLGDTTRQSIFKKYISRVGRQSFYKHSTWDLDYFMQTDEGHPPVSDILESLTNKIFYEQLGWVGDVEGYYIFSALCATLAVIAVYFFTLRIWGLRIALFSVVSLALYPIFFAESHFNIKDVPELSFFTLSIITFYFWVTTRKVKWFLFLTVAFFLGFGTKFNIVFLPIISVIWLFLIRRTTYFKRWFNIGLIGYFLIFGCVNLILLICFWPYLWNGPLEKLAGVFHFYQSTGSFDFTTQVRSPYLLPFHIDARGLIYVLTMTPSLMLMGSIVFFILGIMNKLHVRLGQPIKENIDQYNALLLVVLWCVIPIARVCFPGADTFESIRQYIEFLPALAIISSLGISSLLQIITERLQIEGKLITYISLLLYTAYLLGIIFIYHPNENVYFNILTGGVKGAEQHSLLGWETAYDNPYRQAVNWLNQHAEKKAKLAYLDGTMIALSAEWLRDDIHFGSYFSGYDQKGEYVISIVYPQAPLVFPYLYLERFLTPVYEIDVNGVAIAKIWKNDVAHTKIAYQHRVHLNIPSIITSGVDKLSPYWEIDLGKEYYITNVTLQFPDNCNRSTGVFKLQDFFVPTRVNKLPDKIEFDFPAEKTRYIREYQVKNDSCYANAKVVDIGVLSE